MAKLKSETFIFTVFLILVVVSQSIQLEYIVVNNKEVSGPLIVKREAVLDVPKIKEFLVKTNVANRFAETSVVSVVENPDNYAKQTAFSVVLPKSAFVSGFYMDIEGKQYKAVVKEKGVARTIFHQSISTGQTAGHVAVSTKDSNRFTVTVNVEPQSKVRFKLNYEELLERKIGQYEIITNIQPGQIVKKLRVEVSINESLPLAFVRTPLLRSGSNIVKDYNTTIDPHSNVTLANTSAFIVFEPDVYRQLEFTCKGLGQFVVKFDVVRNNEGGETIYQDGFFLNFFAPQKLDPIPKYIVFVLDTSGSMNGLKIEQLIDAMLNILPQLNEEDLFSIIQYDSNVYIYDLHSKRDVFPYREPDDLPYGHLANELQSFIPAAFTATEEHIEIMKSFIKGFTADSLTNSIGALEIGLLSISKVMELYPKKYEPIMVFLTDGLPNVGTDNTEYIIENTFTLNQAYKVPIYTICFGDDADWNFLEKLSFKNYGKPRKIDVDVLSSDALQDFYKTISIPLLSNVSFNKLPKSEEVTKTNFNLFFKGSELVIAGKGVSDNDTKPISVSATAKQGPMDFEAQLGIPLTRLERVWAYLTVKQLAEEYIATKNATVKHIALERALNYSLVTDFTSLVVVKPDNEDGVVDIEDDSIGIFPREPGELPTCSNITDNFLKTFATTEPETTTLLTINLNSTNHLVESDFGVTGTVTTAATMTTTEPTTTTTLPTTTTILATTTPELTCKESTYGCCYDRVTFALRPNADGCDPIPKAESCSLLQDTGPCTNVTLKWFYSIKQHQCKLFKYGGCGGNGNRFSTKIMCESTCMNPSGPDRCKLPISLGIGNKKLLHWFYDQSKGECVKFMYGGYFGNSNRFINKEKCLQLCNPNMMQKTLEDACFQPKDKGYPHCERNEIYYYFDTTYGQCRKFWFSGCGGNDNRFETKKRCENLCILSKNSGICRAPPEKGPCAAYYQSWFFDTKTLTCEPFVYGGCGGNKNKFYFKKDCEKTCLGR